MLRFLDVRDLCAQLHIGQATSLWASAGRQVDKLVARVDRSPRQNCVQLNSGQSAPIELKCRPDRIHLDGRTVCRTKDVELVMLVIHRHRIVRLVRWPLRPQQRNRSDKKHHEGKYKILSTTLHRESSDSSESKTNERATERSVKTTSIVNGQLM